MQLPFDLKVVGNAIQITPNPLESGKTYTLMVEDKVLVIKTE
jgi:hypothetical protein